MNSNHLEKILIDNILVTNQMVTYAKAFILKNFQNDTSQLLNALLDSVDAQRPDKVVIHPSIDTETIVNKTAKSISWRMAGCEAIWGLISSNCLIPGSTHYFKHNTIVPWTTVVQGSGGPSSRWQLNQFDILVPSKIIKKPSGIKFSEQPISDPDIYLHELEIENIDTDMELSLRESVHCFRHELFLGCLALLGRASEGAWIELGKALAKIISENDSKNSEKLKNSMENQFIGIGKKIHLVLKAYEQKGVFQDVYKVTGYRPVELKSCVVWSDAVRESRNSIHYGAKPAMSNTYEKVAALLIGAVPNLKMMYSIIKNCYEVSE